MKKILGNKMYILGGLIAVVVLAGVGYFAYTKMAMNAESAVPGAQNTAEQTAERDRLLAKLGKLIVLPAETPVMVKIDDADQLKSQQKFFDGAQNGDVVFIFPQSAKAIIFSESRNVVVNSGPVQSQPQEAPVTKTEAVKTDTKAPTPAKTTTSTTKK